NVSGSFLQSSNMDLRIGNSPWNSGYFKGGVDEVRLYNRALTSAEVTELYGLVAQYKFDEGSGTAVSDSTGNGNNGNIVGSAWTTGIGGSALNFNGSGNYVFKSNPSIAIKPSNQVSVSAWVKATTTDSYGSDIVSMGDSYGIRIIPDGNISFVYHNDTTWNILTSTGVNALDNQWHLITGQKTPSSSEIYFDGVLKKSVLGTGVINYDWSAGIYYWIPDWPTYEGGSGSDLRIGKSGHDHTAPDNGGDWGRFYFNGKIDEVRIYNRALSTTEINELYNTSLGLVGHWKLDEISGMIASDSVGTNNGAVANATWTAGKNGNALSFSGENAYVTIGDVFDASSGDMSVAAWVKYDQIKNQEMIMKRHSVSPWASWEFGMNINNEPIFSVVNTAHTYVTAGYQGNVTTDTWYHMIGVKNGNNILFYLNGSDCNTWTETFSGTVQNGDSPLGFGNSTSGGGWSFQGSLDDVRIYNRALSLEEVTGLYTATGGGTVPSCPSKTLPPPQNFGVGISFATPNDPASLLYWTAPTGGIYPLVNYEAENLGEWGPTSLPSTTLNYTDEDVLNGTYYIFEVRAVYRDTVGNIYKSEPASVLIRIPTAEECDCGIWKHCPYVTDAPTYKYAVNFMSQLQMPPGTATTSVVSYSIPSGDYRVKLVSAFKNSVDMIDTNINSKWYVKLTNGGAQVAVTSPSSNFSNIDSYPYYAFKNEIVNESLSIPAATSAQGEWTGSVSAYSPSSTYNYTNAVCAYFEKINPATGLPYTSGSSGAVSIDSFAANQSPINSGSTTVLSWTSSNADYCTASGGWSGFKNLSGSTTTLPIYGTTTFGLKCVSGDGSSEISKVVTVNINSSANTIASVNCQPSPKIANIGQQVTWTVSPIPFSNLYTYSWSGDGLTGSAQTVTKTYSTTGTKTGIVDIGGASNPQQCTGTVRITASPSFDEF
ncbi:MAG: hypothetical protein HW401_744, partial [Parcubacteria group bacterium]|nr:hypothetical protein [Parcubacteria group bacterium]